MHERDQAGSLHFVNGSGQIKAMLSMPEALSTAACAVYTAVFRVAGNDAENIELRPSGSPSTTAMSNGCIPGDRHITVALGRDFSDVSPVRGMVLGGGRSDVAVSVDVARVTQTQQQD